MNIPLYLTLPFESGKCGKEGNEFQKFEYLKNKKYFLDHKKVFFLILEMLSFSKIYKIADTSFK